MHPPTTDALAALPAVVEAHDAASAVVAPTIPTTPSADAASAPATVDAGAGETAGGRVEDVGGLRITFLPNGRVTIRGTDQWGGRLDTEYETMTFFRNAVPTLSRAVTPEQAAALRRLAGH